MTAATFDTREAAQTLQDSGFTEPQAIAAVTVIRDAMTEGVATKADLRAEIAELKTYLTVRIFGAAGLVIGVIGIVVAVMFGLLRLL